MVTENGRLEGTVLNIQKFTVHDGPGIRTEVFLKGCPLKCKWCSNPESIATKIEIGLFEDQCIGLEKCGWCVSECPLSDEEVLIIRDKKVVGIDREKCLHCLKCAKVCPRRALKIWGIKMTVDEVMKEILADRSFYQKSGGGVTLSGGDPLVQVEFSLEILKACKKFNIHTIVESELQCSNQILDRVLPYTDMIFTDIKHMDSEQHKIYTGVGNELILKNIKYLVEKNMPLVIRIPIVPEHNNSDENIRATAEFIINELGNRVRQVQLLPYRPLGTDKYQSLAIEYPMSDIKAPAREVYEPNIRHLTELMRSYGIPAAAGSTDKIQ